MALSIKQAPEEVQPLLLDVEPDLLFKTHCAARTHYGAVCQEAVCALMGLAEIPNSGNYDVVFDAQCLATKQFFEIKSLHATNKAPLYIWRREKETQTGLSPFYLFAIHRVRGAKGISECWDRFAESLSEIAVLSVHTVNALCEGVKVRQLVRERPGSRMGYERKGYCEGYQNLSVQAIREAEAGSVTTLQANVHGRGFQVQVNADVLGWNFLHERANSLSTLDEKLLAKENSYPILP